MIYSTVLLALAANALWITPGYKKFIAPRYKRVELGYTGMSSEEFENMLSTNINAQYENVSSGIVITSRKWHVEKQSNWFARKPFTCSFCMSFWLAVVYLVSIYSILLKLPEAASVPPLVALPFAVAFLSEALNRWFSSLPIKF